MKLLAAILLLSVTQVFAHDVCQLRSTSETTKKLQAMQVVEENYNQVERQMILAVMRLDTWRVVANEYDAVVQFNDEFRCAPSVTRGEDAGRIEYFRSESGEEIALVHFSRDGLHENGAYFKLTNQSAQRLANVIEGRIICQ